MIRRNTWILLILLVALVGFFYYFNNRKAQQASAATPTLASQGAASTDLFSPEEGQPTDVKVQDSTGRSVEVKRNASGQWVLQAPTAAQADQASAEAAATQVTSLKVISSVQLGFDIVGLDKPTYTMTFAFSGGKTHSLAVGALTPIQDGYYSSLDKGPVRIVDKPGIDALVQLLSQPPYAATPVPPTATAETATAAPQETSPAPGTSSAPGATDTTVAPTQPAPASPTP